YRVTGLVFVALLTSRVFAHGGGPWGIQPIEWKNDQISQVIGLGHSGRHVMVEGRDCVAGGMLGFNVRDEYAFDLDEPVWLDVEFALGATEQTVSVKHDRSDVAQDWVEAPTIQIHLPARTDQHWYRQSIRLERARFANLGFLGTDFLVSGS